MTEPYTRQLVTGFWGLLFKGSLEREYRRAQAEDHRWHAYAITVLVAVIVAYFCVFDIQRFQLLSRFAEIDSGVWGLQIIRWLTLAALLPMLARPARFGRQLELKMSVVATLVAVNILAGQMVLIPRGIPIADFGQLLVIALFLIAGTQFYTSLAIALGFVAATQLLVPLAIGESGAADQAMRLFMLMMALLVGAIGGYMHERSLRRQFLTQRIATHLASHDGLTGLNNRRSFESLLAEKLAGPDSPRLSLALIDIDHFKRFNDRFGHSGGDAVLRSVARTLEASVRAGHEFTARIGGEEFAIVLVDDEAAPAPPRIARVLAAIRTLTPTVGVTGTTLPEAFDITASAGVTRCRSGDTNESLYRRADDHLYRSKRHGRDRLTSDEDIAREISQAHGAGSPCGADDADDSTRPLTRITSA